MTTQQLTYFIALAEKLNYTSVVNAFYISQPTLSRQIINLENELGVPLFVRAKNRIELTAEGKKFYDGLVPIHKNFSDLVTEIQDSHLQKKNSLSIGIMNDQLVSNLLLLALNMLTQSNPQIKYYFFRESRDKLWNGFLSGTYDIINVISFPQDNVTYDMDFLVLDIERPCIAIKKGLEPEMPFIIDKKNLYYLLEKYVLFLAWFDAYSSVDPLELLRMKHRLNLKTNFVTINFTEENDVMSLPMQILSGKGITITNSSNLFSVDPNIQTFEISEKENVEMHKKGIYYRKKSNNPNLKCLLGILQENEDISIR